MKKKQRCCAASMVWLYPVISGIDQQYRCRAYKLSGGLNGGVADWEQASKSIQNIGSIVTAVLFLNPILAGVGGGVVIAALAPSTIVLFGILAATALSLIKLEIALSTLDGGPCDDALLALAIGGILIGLLGPILANMRNIGLTLLERIALLFIPLVTTSAVIPAHFSCGKYS